MSDSYPHFALPLRAMPNILGFAGKHILECNVRRGLFPGNFIKNKKKDTKSKQEISLRRSAPLYVTCGVSDK